MWRRISFEFVKISKQIVVLPLLPTSKGFFLLQLHNPCLSIPKQFRSLRLTVYLVKIPLNTAHIPTTFCENRYILLLQGNFCWPSWRRNKIQEWGTSNMAQKKTSTRRQHHQPIQRKMRVSQRPRSSTVDYQFLLIYSLSCSICIGSC